MWKIWQARNDAVFKQKMIFPEEVSLAAVEFVHDYNRANLRRQQMGIQFNEQLQIIPNPECCTFVIDARCFRDGFTCWGCILRNQHGEVIFTASKREDIATDPILAEALGVRWCLQLALDQKL